MFDDWSDLLNQDEHGRDSKGLWKKKEPIMADEVKKARGLKGVLLSFEAVKDKTLGEIFGTQVQPITDVNKKMWQLVKENNLRK